MSITMHAIEILAMYLIWLLIKLDTFYVELKKTITIMTDNKALTKLFQLKKIPPSLSNFGDQTMQFNFVLAHFLGSQNTAADYMSRLEVRPEERKHLKITVSNPVFQIEVGIASETLKQQEDDIDY